jgi:transcriptional regulator NrdR family protein
VQKLSDDLQSACRKCGSRFSSTSKIDLWMLKKSLQNKNLQPQNMQQLLEGVAVQQKC